MTPRVVAVGSPPSFRRDVSAALDVSAESIPWAATTLDAQVLLDGPGGYPDVLIVSADVEDQLALDLADYVSSRAPATAIVLVRYANPNGNLAAFVRAGVRDFVQAENGPVELREALGRALAWSDSLRHSQPTPTDESDSGMLVTIFSSKGGTGKSFLAANVASAIAQMGHTTAIIDVDVEMGDVLSYFGAEAQRSLHDIIEVGDKLNLKTLMTLGNKLEDNLWGFGSPTDVGALKVTGDAMSKALKAIKLSFSHTIVDVPASYDEAVLAALDLSDFVCLIAGLDVVGIKHLSKAIETLSYIGVPKEKLMIVLNRADSKVGLEPADVERLLNIKIDALIPSSRSVPASLNKGRPVVLEEPRAAVSLAVQGFAHKLAAIPVETGAMQRSPRKKRLHFGRA